MPLRRMRELFAILEQQRVSRNAVEMGAPSPDRMASMEMKKKAEIEAKKIVDRTNDARKDKPKSGIDKGGKNATADKGK